ncbi:DUF4139 domain-containing protein [Stieleria sp. TO1_6]|uniref:DUF4139 domain-containing protein n=1 Tax=Stieleria tagensis TaxID=2956795 RepID=UPI00209A76B2|nr:DUF4139 domain-containing protein [Stieleria tagensis]MCO8121305.1 DUF4139 domain-containing protein [Stieleria tagensis]
MSLDIRCCLGRTIVLGSLSVAGYLLVSGPTFAANEIPLGTPVDSKVTSVTVFRQQANVTRELKLNPDPDLQTIHISGLPPTYRDRSLQWESDSSISVHSLQVVPHRPEQSSDQPDPRQQKRQSEMTAMQDAAHKVAVIEQDLETLERLVTFSSEKTNQSLNQSKLDVATITELSDFVMQRRRKLAEELHLARRDLQQTQQRQQQQFEQTESLQESATRPTFDAVLSVTAPRGGRLRVSYWVDDVSWEPRYTVQATSDPAGQDKFDVQLQGVVSQHSGEDWQDVQLSFCTGVPNLQAASPLLVPLRVTTAHSSAATTEQSIDFNPLSAPFDALPGWEDAALWQRNVALNTQAAARQVSEINQRQGVQREMADDAISNLADETYQVPGRLRIADQSEQQTVMIFHTQMSSPIYRVVTPLLSSFAHREAVLENQTGQSLVGGEAMVFLDGQFVGQTTLPPTAAGGELTVGLGADRQVRTRRELLNREEAIQGGNRLTKLSYRLVVSNYNATEIAIRLYDRVPISDDSAAVNVIADGNSLGPLSDDAKYLRMRRPTGILRWDLTVPAKRFGSDAYDHDYHYTVESDRTQPIVSNDVQQQIQDGLRFDRSGGGGMGGGMGGGGAF